MRRSRSFGRFSGYLFVVPALLLLLAFRFGPMLVGVKYSFYDWDGIGQPLWVGLGNYRELLLTDPVFHATMRNTLLVLLAMPVWVLLPLALAIAIHLGVPGGGFYRAAFFLPVVLSSIIIGTMFNVLLRYDGQLNHVIASLGMEPVDWLGGPDTALVTVMAVQIWAHFGMNVLIFLSGLAGVPRELLEAARIDGASLRQIVWHVIVPELRPVIELVTVVSSITLLTSMFGLIYTMTAGGPGTATYLPEYLIWVAQGTLSRLGYASAVSVLLFLVVGTVGYIQIRMLRRQEDIG